MPVRLPAAGEQNAGKTLQDQAGESDAVLIDTHCHLAAAEFAEDRAAVVAAAQAGGITALVVPSVSADEFAAVRDCCRRHPACQPAYGIHPLYVDRAGEDDLARLRDWLRQEADGAQAPVAVGEIGLDFLLAQADSERQQHFFREQLKIARDAGLPVLLHSRRALDQVLAGLRRMGVDGGIAHAFNGSRQQADEFLRQGCKLGFGGTLSQPRASRIRQLAATLPDDAIVLETDSPDMPPTWLAGGRNTPAELPRFLAILAELRDAAPQQLAEMTSANARQVLPRLRLAV